MTLQYCFRQVGFCHCTFEQVFQPMFWSGWQMASKNVKVSQNFSEISRVSQSRFLSGSERLAVSNFFCKAILESKPWSHNPKTLKSLGLAEKNAGIAVSQRLVFTIRHPFWWARRVSVDTGTTVQIASAEKLKYANSAVKYLIFFYRK